MYGHQEVLANELIELEIVHMTVRADLRRVHDDEHVVRIDMNAWNVVAVSALGDRHRMEAEVALEKHLCLIAPLRNIEPEEAIGLFSQGRQIWHQKGAITPGRSTRLAELKAAPWRLADALTSGSGCGVV